MPAQPQPTNICFECIGRRAERTLATVASSVTSGEQAELDPSPGSVGFMGPALDGRGNDETPCIAEDDCGGISTQEPVQHAVSRSVSI